MRDPPESTAVKAPLSAANFCESSAVYFARETARSSSASKTSSFFSEAAGATPSVAMAAAGRIGEGAEEEKRRGLDPILWRLFAGTRYDGGDLRPVGGGTKAAAAAEMEVNMAGVVCYKRGVCWAVGKSDRWIYA
jgi:hypothetical protein